MIASPVSAQPCTGNCDADDGVAVGEIVVGVNLALGLLPIDICPIFDGDNSGAVQIDELITAIAFSLRGCPPTPQQSASPTATTSPTIATPPTATASASPTATPTVEPSTSTPTPTATSAATGLIEGRFEVAADFFGDAPGECQTVIGDCNGDGLLDVVRLLCAAHNPPHLYVQQSDGRFAPAELSRFVPSNSGSFADLDGDGLEDLVLSSANVVLLRGRGDCTFDPPREIGQVCDRQTLQTLVTDADLDGLSDVVLSCNGADPITILLARGDGGYEPISPPPAVESDFGYPMFGVVLDDFDGDGTRDLLMMVDADKSWFSWAVPGDVPQYSIDAALTEAIYPINPMGTALLDYDRDGKTEYFISGTVRNQFYGNRTGGRELADLAGDSGIAVNTEATSFSPYAFDADLDGWSDILVIRRGGYRPEDEHPVHPYLFLNQRDGTFRDVGTQVVDTPIISTILTCGDLSSDGHIGCFAGDPHGTFLLRNRIKPAGNWVGVRLRGTVSSAEASGARVSLDGASPPLVIQTGQSPAWGEHARDVILAIGEAASATVSIEWPSGIVQRVENLPAATYTTVTETKALTVSQRVAPADGETLVEVTVDLTAAGGTAASIEREGAGTWTGAPTLADGILRRQLRAPDGPGSARIEVELDGVALRVRPRIRFEATQSES